MFLPNLTAEQSRKRTALWSLALCTLLGLGLGALPLYRVLKAQRARNFIAQAERLVALRRWDEALRKAQAAWQLNPQDVYSLRAMARILGDLRREEAFQFWTQVADRQKLTASDLQEILGLALELKRLDVAERYLAEAMQQKPVAAEAFRAAALVCHARGDSVETIRFARAVLARQPWDIEIELLLARRLLAAREAGATREARSLLWHAARTTHPGALLALSTIIHLPDLSPEEAAECQLRLEALPADEPVRDFLALDLQLRLEPKRRSGIIAGAITRFRKEPTLLALARWLNQQGEFKQTLEVVPTNVALGQKDFFLVCCDALAALGGWPQLESLLAQEKLPIDPVLVELYRARVAGQLKKDRQAALHWAQVHWLASTNPPALWHVAEYAEKIGERTEAIKAYKRLTQDPASARAAYLALVRLADQKSDTAVLRSLMKELIALYPNDPAPRNDLAYLDLLARENVSSAKQEAAELVRRHPDLLAYRTTLALACLRLNQPQDAQSLYRDMQVNAQTAAPGWQAVYAAVLGANGKTEAARQLARSIPRDLLKPEERALVEPFR